MKKKRPTENEFINNAIERARHLNPGFDKIDRDFLYESAKKYVRRKERDVEVVNGIRFDLIDCD